MCSGFSSPSPTATRARTAPPSPQNGAHVPGCATAPAASARGIPGAVVRAGTAASCAPQPGSYPRPAPLEHCPAPASLPWPRTAPGLPEIPRKHFSVSPQAGHVCEFWENCSAALHIVTFLHFCSGSLSSDAEKLTHTNEHMSLSIPVCHLPQSLQKTPYFLLISVLCLATASSISCPAD